MKHIVVSTLMIVFFVFSMQASEFEKDVIKTSEGDLTLTFIGHGTLMMEFNGKVIHIDPYSRLADYSKLPKANLILLTHQHGDHLDLKAIDLIKTGETEIVQTKTCAEKNKGTAILGNNEKGIFCGLKVEAVPAYNIKNKRNDGTPFHPEGEGNGYVIHFGDKKVYVAGDTENIPEMANLKDIEVAFLPMNLPYTMTPEMVANAAKIFNPKIIYPYHFGNTNAGELLELLKDEKNIEVRIRKF